MTSFQWAASPLEIVGPDPAPLPFELKDASEEIFQAPQNWKLNFEFRDPLGVCWGIMHAPLSELQVDGANFRGEIQAPKIFFSPAIALKVWLIPEPDPLDLPLPLLSQSIKVKDVGISLYLHERDEILTREVICDPFLPGEMRYLPLEAINVSSQKYLEGNRVTLSSHIRNMRGELVAFDNPHLHFDGFFEYGVKRQVHLPVEIPLDIPPDTYWLDLDWMMKDVGWLNLIWEKPCLKYVIQVVEDDRQGLVEIPFTRDGHLKGLQGKLVRFPPLTNLIAKVKV